jgi:hypothetical protein
MRDLMFQKSAAVFYAMAMLVGTVGAAHADTLFTVPNTGPWMLGAPTDGNYAYYSTTTDPSINPGKLPTGTNWQAGYVIDSNAWPLGGGPWNSNTGTGQWIGPTPQYVWYNNAYYLTAPSNTYFVYQATFVIPTGADLSRVLISGFLSSDNCVTNIGVNSTGLGSVISAANCSMSSYSSPYAFQIGSANASAGSGGTAYFAYNSFKIGVNTIQFIVYNDGTGPGSPNPTGLVVWDMQGIVQSPAEIPEPATAGLLIAGIAALSWLRRRRSSASV